jgi:7,8-dihydropterin-6-yl-methyl-4-(beta-D-ribofuranosyl)aminobenzene 5'-phosphate synthase
MKTKITVLCENSVFVPFPLIAEHGLSFFIEREDASLFDTGQGFGVLNNMKALGKNPASIQRIVLSHGHYDHTGGLMSVLKEKGGRTRVYLHETAFNDKRALIPTPAAPLEVPIGMRAPRADYEQAGADFTTISGFTPITAGITALTDVTREAGWKTWDTRLKHKVEGTIEDDPFNDDLSLLIETESGPVVLLGCAHAGICEILDDFASRTGTREFHAVIGGTHLETAPSEYTDKAIQALRDYRVKRVAVSHCTGFKIACRMAAEFKDEFATASVGAVFEF